MENNNKFLHNGRYIVNEPSLSAGELLILSNLVKDINKDLELNDKEYKTLLATVRIEACKKDYECTYH